MEKWVNLKYEGFEHYEISNLGRLRKSNYIMKDRINARGYKMIGLRLKGDKCNIQKMFLMHRIVADHFIEKIEGKNYVNHIDLNKTNNKVENLEWVTQIENIEHAKMNGRYAYWETNGVRVKKIKKKPIDRRIKVRVINKKSGIDKVFDSIEDLVKMKYKNCSSKTTIKRLLDKKFKSRLGYEIYYL